MNHTTNYNLPQWEDADRVTRGDFNGAMQSIDAAVKSLSDAAGAKAEIVYGTYTGTGTGGSLERACVLTFDSPPKLVIIVGKCNSRSGDHMIMARPLTACFPSDYNYLNVVVWGDNTVSWYCSYGASTQFNMQGETYSYIALL